jgi:type II secretory pathway pseudopilin PulG
MRPSPKESIVCAARYLKKAIYSTYFFSQPRPLKRVRGFTLLEMLMASLLVIVGLLSLLSLILFALKMRYDSRLSSTALKLSQQIIEEFKSRSPDDPVFSNPGNALTSDGAIDFEAGLDPLASSIKSLQLNQTLNTQLVFETRWNITSLSDKKILTVATRKRDWEKPQFSPVNLKLVLTTAF